MTAHRLLLSRALLIVFAVAAGTTGIASVHAQTPVPGVRVQGTYTGEVVGVTHGGQERGVVYLDNVDLTVTARLDSFVSWRGLTAFAYGLGNQGGSPSKLVGDAQVTSNIEAPSAWHLYEGWLQQRFGSRASILVGLYDLNSEFDVNRTGQLFLNSSHGIGAAFGTSGRNGPSIFPVTSLGLRVRVRVGHRSYVQSALLDGIPGCPASSSLNAVRLSERDGVLVAGEVGTYLGRTSSSASALVDRTSGVQADGKLAVGGWAYTTDLPVWSSVHTSGPVRRGSGSAGFYLLAEGRLFSESESDEQGLSAFARVGWATERHNRFSSYSGVGLVYRGLLPGRPNDRTGVAVASAHNGTPYMNAQRRAGQPVTGAEVNLEATYAAAIHPAVQVIGDVQYVINPNTDSSIENALQLGARVVVQPW